MIFDYSDRIAQFIFERGRVVSRHYDGFYHVTPQEWEEIEVLQGVTRMDGG